MSKIIIAIIIIIVIGLGYWAYQSIVTPEEEPISEGSKACAIDDNCVVFGETGDCNCGCYNKDDLPSGTGGECFCAAPTSCECVNAKCEGIFEGITKKQACIDSGGTVSTSLCCTNTDDFPNLCLVGPCGCAPDYSHEIQICDCGPNKCFNGNVCVPLELPDEITQCEFNEMIFYYREGCSWCGKVKDDGSIPEIEELGVNVTQIDVTTGPVEHEFPGVPTFVIGDEVYVGYRTFEQLKELLGC